MHLLNAPQIYLDKLKEYITIIKESQSNESGNIGNDQ